MRENKKKRKMKKIGKRKKEKAVKMKKVKIRKNLNSTTFPTLKLCRKSWKKKKEKKRKKKKKKGKRKKMMTKTISNMGAIIIWESAKFKLLVAKNGIRADFVMTMSIQVLRESVQWKEWIDMKLIGSNVSFAKKNRSPPNPANLALWSLPDIIAIYATCGKTKKKSRFTIAKSAKCAELEGRKHYITAISAAFVCRSVRKTRTSVWMILRISTVPCAWKTWSTRRDLGRILANVDTLFTSSVWMTF